MKNKKVFACQSCGFQSPKWQGKCPDCGQWNSLVEETYADPAAAAAAGKGFGSFKSDLKAESATEARAGASKPQKIAEIHADHASRRKTHYVELDRVLGGGIV